MRAGHMIGRTLGANLTLALDGNRDGNLGELRRVGERWRTKRAGMKYAADVGERPRTVTDGLKVALKTTKVQAFGGSNPSPSASNSYSKLLAAQ